MSRDAHTGQTEAKPVAQTFVREVEQTLILSFANGEHVETTPGHPFFVEGKGFVLAGQLALGNAIVTRAGPATILVNIQNKAERTRVYNFEVADFHTYFVGNRDGGLWVHNTSYPEIALGKFSSGLQQFTRNLGRNATYFNDWDYNRLELEKEINVALSWPLCRKRR